jgi:hypothetical protein
MDRGEWIVCLDCISEKSARLYRLKMDVRIIASVQIYEHLERLR